MASSWPPVRRRKCSPRKISAARTAPAFSPASTMDWLFEPFTNVFMQRALVACALIGFTNGFMGAFVVLRRLALMADSLSHSLLPGLAVGLLLFGLAPMGLFFGALVAALFVALGAQLIARNSRLKEDTALGLLYTVAFSLGVVMI